jgi:hypothetical protein
MEDETKTQLALTRSLPFTQPVGPPVYVATSRSLHSRWIMPRWTYLRSESLVKVTVINTRDDDRSAVLHTLQTRF